MSENKTFLRLKNYVPQISDLIIEVFDWNRVDRFYEFLVRENERGGFFSKQDSLVIFERHIVDRLIFVWKLWNEKFVSRETNLVDVGTGPGLPGFIFACLHEFPYSITLLDSQFRKLSLLEKEVLHGDLSDVKDKINFMYERAENIKKKFDVVTSRAVIPYPYLAEVVTNLVRKKGLLCPYLGQLKFNEQIEAEVLANAGFNIKKEIELSELSFLGKRHIKILQKDSEPKQGYPRPWKEIVKETKQSHG